MSQEQKRGNQAANRLQRKVRRYTDTEIEKHLELCEFENECDFCEKPGKKVWCELDSYYNEANFYCCEKCVDKKMDSILAAIKFYENFNPIDFAVDDKSA